LEKAIELLRGDFAKDNPRHIAPHAAPPIRAHQTPASDHAMPPPHQRADHRAGVLLVLRLPENRAIPLTDRIRRENPSRRRAPCRALGSDTPRFEVGERRRNFPSVNIAEHQSAVVEVRGLNFDFEACIPQHGDSPRRTTREDKGRLRNRR
jgi:hypothetical protein